MNALYNWMSVSKSASISMDHIRASVTKDMQLSAIDTTLARVSHAGITYTEIIIILFLDINECDPSLVLCEHLCTNSNGSFTCDCQPGYSITIDQLSCLGKSTNTISFMSKLRVS